MAVSNDYYENKGDTPIAPSRAPFAIVPHDSNALASIPKAIFVGTGGQITLRGAEGSADVVFKNLANGQVLDVQAKFVRASGTTATDLVGLA